MRKLILPIAFLLGCPTGDTKKDDTEADTEAVTKTEEKAEEKSEEKAEEKADPNNTLCFKAAGVVESSLQGTVHSKKYDPEKYLADCEKKVTGSKGDAWKAYYECMVEVGDKGYVVKCAGKSPGI